MSAVVRIIVDKQSAGTTLRLPEVPVPGDLLELADGTRLIVRETHLRTTGIVAADVRAKSAS